MEFSSGRPGGASPVATVTGEVRGVDAVVGQRLHQVPVQVSVWAGAQKGDHLVHVVAGLSRLGQQLTWVAIGRAHRARPSLGTVRSSVPAALLPALPRPR